MSQVVNLRSLEKRLDAMALEQLRQVAAEQSDEIEELRIRLANAEDDADYWREQFMELQLQIAADTPHRAIGMTKAGELLLIEKSSGEVQPS